MSALLKSTSLSHAVDIFLILGDFFRIRFLPRHGDRHQKIDRNAERTSKLLMKKDGSFALSRFKVRQIPLSYANGLRQHGLCKLSPFAQNADRIVARRKPINDGLRQQDLMASRHRRTRLTHQAGGADILIGRQGRKALVFRPGQNGEFLSASGFDELDLIHEGLSIVNLAAMSDSNDNNGISLDIKNDAPVSDAQPRAVLTLQPLHIPLPRLRESCELSLKPSSHVGRKPKPLSRGRRCPNDFHFRYIAFCYILVKQGIAYRDWQRST
jgi:hypothetical protein